MGVSVSVFRKHCLLFAFMTIGHSFGICVDSCMHTTSKTLHDINDDFAVRYDREYILTEFNRTLVSVLVENGQNEPIQK